MFVDFWDTIEMRDLLVWAPSLRECNTRVCGAGL